jgi:cation transport ATPase
MKKKFVIEGLDCADCASKIEVAVKRIDGVKEATVNFMTQKLVIEGEDEKMPDIILKAEKLVGKIELGATLKKA